jgi:hypothetical protein
MKVKCIIDSLSDIKDSLVAERIHKYISSGGGLDFKKNKEYCVYGITFRDNSPWYYLCDEDHDEYPIGYPAEIFEITDSRLSSYWRLLTYPHSMGVISKLVIDEWVKDPYLHEQLVDGDPEAISLFKHYKKLMDRE